MKFNVVALRFNGCFEIIVGEIVVKSPYIRPQASRGGLRNPNNHYHNNKNSNSKNHSISNDNDNDNSKYYD